jgi:hypothetical protein
MEGWQLKDENGEWKPLAQFDIAELHRVVRAGGSVIGHWPKAPGKLELTKPVLHCLADLLNDFHSNPAHTVDDLWSISPEAKQRWDMELHAAWSQRYP